MGSGSSMLEEGISVPFDDVTYIAPFGNMSDKLRVVNFPAEIEDLIISTVEEHYPRGIGSVKRAFHIVVLKLNGRPWYASGGDTMVSRFLFMHLLSSLASQGYHLRACIDSSRYDDMSGLYFKKDTPLPGPQSMICLSFHSTDKVRISTNMPELDESLAKWFEAQIIESWPRGIQSDGYYDSDRFGRTVYQFKLSGNPWNASGAETVDARILANALMSKCSSVGMQHLGAADLSQKEGDLSSVYFNYQGEASARPVTGIISLNMSDRVRVFCDEDMEQVKLSLGNTIRSFWGDIQNESQYSAMYEYKLRGNPWDSSGEEAIRSRLLMCGVLEAMLKDNYILQQTVDLSKKLSDKSTFFFHRRRGGNIQAEVVCVSLNQTDRIRVISITPKPAVESVVRECVNTCWLLDISREKTLSCGIEFKLDGNPWGSRSLDDNTASKLILAMIISSLEKQGIHFYCAADVSGKYGGGDDNRYKIDASSIFFTVGKSFS